MTRKKNPSLSRNQSLQAKPAAVEVIGREPLDNGGQRLIVTTTPSRLQKFLLRLPDRIEHKFELDPFGLEVFEMCDGQKTVQYIIKQFARKHSLDPHEAHRAVLEFLRVLIRKGLVHILVARHQA